MAVLRAHNLEVDRIIPANRNVNAGPSRHAAVARSMLKMSGFLELGWPGSKSSPSSDFTRPESRLERLIESGSARRRRSGRPGRMSPGSMQTLISEEDVPLIR